MSTAVSAFSPAQIFALKRELQEAQAAAASSVGLKEECGALRQELKLLKDER